MIQGSGEGSRPSAGKWKCPRKGASKDTKKRKEKDAGQDADEPQPKQRELPLKAAPGQERGGGPRIRAVNVVFEASGSCAGGKGVCESHTGEGMSPVTFSRTRPRARITFCQRN